MNTQRDFEEFLALLPRGDVDYVLVGGYAVAFHGYPRFTKELDVFYRSSADNVARLRDVLVDFGFSRSDVDALGLEREGEIVRIGIPPVQIDLLNRIDGVRYDEVAPEAVEGRYGSVTARFIGKRHLILNKQSTHRLRDKADAEELSGDA